MKDIENKKIIKVNVGGESSSSGGATIKLRAYFSSYHLYAATHFLELATIIEDNGQVEPVFNIEHRAYVHNSILSSVAFLEAAINELFQDAHDETQTYINDLDPSIIENLSSHWADTEIKSNFKSTLVKYQQALRIAGKEAMREGEPPFQNTKLVIELRNFLTHYKPKSLGGDTTHPLEVKLKGEFPLNKKYDKSGNKDFPDKMLGIGCAEWSIKSVKNFADEFFKRMDIKPNYQAVDMEKLGGKK
ncbi:MAG: hypothetical protein KAJ31_01505 [Deltaproteobacteria bacterium]|nr:hypothetical protein [Deltaproteobacteria bacterium]